MQRSASQNLHGRSEFEGFSLVVRLPKRLAQYIQNPAITNRPEATRPMIGARTFSTPIPPGCWSMSTASSVKNNAARMHTMPPNMRRVIAIMEVSPSLGTTSLAEVSPRAYLKSRLHSTGGQAHAPRMRRVGNDSEGQSVRKALDSRRKRSSWSWCTQWPAPGTLIKRRFAMAW